MSEEKKIIIDEDWKTRVQAEKEEAEKRGAAADAGDTAHQTRAEDVSWPPASFELLLTTLITEAMVALGQLPHPVTGKMESSAKQAKYFIDTVEVLKDKTKGNLSSGEQAAIDNALHQLRLAFLAAEQSPAESAPTGEEKKGQPE